METFKTSAWPVPRRRDSGRKGSLDSYLKILGRIPIERYNGARHMVPSTKGEVNSFSRCKYEFESRWHFQQGFKSLEIVGLYLST